MLATENSRSSAPPSREDSLLSSAAVSSQSDTARASNLVLYANDGKADLEVGERRGLSRIVWGTKLSPPPRGGFATVQLSVHSICGTLCGRRERVRRRGETMTE